MERERKKEVQISCGDGRIDSLKERLKNMEYWDLHRLVVSVEFIPDTPLDRETHQLAPKDQDCEECRAQNNDHYRCKRHQRKCTCGLRFEKLSTWRYHRNQWKEKPYEFQILSQRIRHDDTVAVLSKSQNSCYEMICSFFLFKSASGY